MTRLLCLILPLACLLAACTGGSNATARTSETVVGAVDRSLPLQQLPDQRNDKSPAFALRMASATAAKGQRVCLPVEATGTDQLIGLQFTMRFDSAALRYHSFRELSLPQLTLQNFGIRFAERGVVAMLWTDPTLKGITLPEHSKFFELCFLNLQEKGQQTEVRITDGPTAMEVVNSDMSQPRFVYANGTVTSGKPK